MGGILLQNGKQAFRDNNGRPLSGGRVFFFLVGTQTPKDTFQDLAQTIPNTNPIILDARGEASIYGTGTYRQVLRDASLNLIWDQVIPDVAGAVNDFLAGLSDPTDPNKGAGQISRATRQINSLAELRSISGRYTNDMIYLERYSSGFNFGDGEFVWDGASALADNGVTIIQPTAGGTGRWLRLSNELTASMFGCRAVTGFDNTAPLAAIETFLRAELAAFRTLPSVTFEAGTYEFTTGPNFGIQGATILNQGKVKLRCTGAGPAMSLDAGTGTGVNLTNMVFGQGAGFILECGPAATATTCFIRNCYQSEFRARVWGAGLAQAGFQILGCVLSRFWITTRPTESSKEKGSDYINGWYLGGKPATGKSVSESAAGAQTAYCNFYDWSGAACQYGMYIDSTLGNAWFGGDNEYCTTTGSFWTAKAIGNRVYGMNHEVNTGSDVECAGQFNQFDCDTVLFKFTGGSGNRLIGGMHDQITLSGGTGNYVGNVTYGRGLSGNLLIVDQAINSSFGPCYQAQSKTWSNGPSVTASIAVGASPFTYTNTSNRNRKVSIMGGTVSNVTYYRGGFVLGVVMTNSIVELAPGDFLNMTYTAAPTMNYITD